MISDKISFDEDDRILKLKFIQDKKLFYHGNLIDLSNLQVVFTVHISCKSTRPVIQLIRIGITYFKTTLSANGGSSSSVVWLSWPEETRVDSIAIWPFVNLWSGRRAIYLEEKNFGLMVFFFKIN